MTRAIIPVEGKGVATFTTKTVSMTRKKNSSQAEDLRQNYVDRIRSYIPVEVVAFYVFVNSLISDNLGTVLSFSTITIDGYVSLIATVFGIIGTVIYTKATSKDIGIRPWKLSASIAIMGFIIWIYAMDSKVFSVLNIDVVPSVSGLLLASFTLFIGVIVPTTKRKDNDEDLGTLVNPNI